MLIRLCGLAVEQGVEGQILPIAHFLIPVNFLTGKVYCSAGWLARLCHGFHLIFYDLIFRLYMKEKII